MPILLDIMAWQTWSNPMACSDLQDENAEGLRAIEQELRDNAAALAEEKGLHGQFAAYGCDGSSKKLASLLLPVGDEQVVTTTYHTGLVSDRIPQLLLMLRHVADVIREVTVELHSLLEKEKELDEEERKKLGECQKMALFALYGAAALKMKPYRRDWAAETERLRGKTELKDFHEDFQVG